VTIQSNFHAIKGSQPLSDESGVYFQVKPRLDTIARECLSELNESLDAAARDPGSRYENMTAKGLRNELFQSFQKRFQIALVTEGLLQEEFVVCNAKASAVARVAMEETIRMVYQAIDSSVRTMERSGERGMCQEAVRAFKDLTIGIPEADSPIEKVFLGKTGLSLVGLSLTASSEIIALGSHISSRLAAAHNSRAMMPVIGPVALTTTAISAAASLIGAGYEGYHAYSASQFHEECRQALLSGDPEKQVAFLNKHLSLSPEEIAECSGKTDSEISLSVQKLIGDKGKRFRSFTNEALFQDLILSKPLSEYTQAEVQAFLMDITFASLEKVVKHSVNGGVYATNVVGAALAVPTAGISLAVTSAFSGVMTLIDRNNFITKRIAQGLWDHSPEGGCFERELANMIEKIPEIQSMEQQESLERLNILQSDCFEKEQRLERIALSPQGSGTAVAFQKASDALHHSHQALKNAQDEHDKILAGDGPMTQRAQKEKMRLYEISMKKSKLYSITPEVVAARTATAQVRAKRSEEARAARLQEAVATDAYFYQLLGVDPAFPHAQAGFFAP